MTDKASVQKYVRLLSVHMFHVMEKGEKIVLSDTKTPKETASFVSEQTQNAHAWISALVKLDHNLCSEDIELLLQKSKMMTSGRIEERLNIMAIVLMLLDDYYHVFSFGNRNSQPEATTTFIPMKSLQDFEMEVPSFKPRLV